MRLKLLVVAVTAIVVPVLATAPARAANVTVAPDLPADDSNCFPFGIGAASGDHWLPVAAFFYRDIPAFTLHSDDEIGFDLSDLNDEDIELEIAMSRATTNGGIEEAKPFKRVVKNTQTPDNPRGNNTIGDFELTFTAEAKFEFRGGGLIIRFSDPSSSYASDTTCTSTLVSTDSSDPSGFFVQRAFNDADGVFPWPDFDLGFIGGFRITDLTPPQTKITKHPKKQTDKQKAKFRFDADERDSTFKCKLDQRRFKPCGQRKPKKKYKGLDVGEHKFKVKATDALGHTDRTPAKFKWEITP